MAKRLDRETVRRFILDRVAEHPADIARIAAKGLGVSRQTAHAHLKKMADEGVLIAEGNTRRRRYLLAEVVVQMVIDLDLDANRDEDLVWRHGVAEHLEGLPDNVLTVCHHGFTEMFNNIIDHSEGTHAAVEIRRTAANVILRVKDNGIGIFEKICSTFGLDDHRHAILELSKGKLTTDPDRHSGEGIYFTSRMFDRFSILSGLLFFTHRSLGGDWLLEDQEDPTNGTFVEMEISTGSTRTPREVYDQHIRETPTEEFAFARTHVPLRLATYGQDGLVSRSQAKRVLARFERFKEVFLDFEGVSSIGQGFADEIFRVFRNAHPEIGVFFIRANDDIRRMIMHAGYRPPE